MSAPVILLVLSAATGLAAMRMGRRVAAMANPPKSANSAFEYVAYHWQAESCLGCNTQNHNAL